MSAVATKPRSSASGRQAKAPPGQLELPIGKPAAPDPATGAPPPRRGKEPAPEAPAPAEAPAEEAAPRKGKSGRLDAAALGKLQREISVSEFFTKNRHLLGFDNPRKALLTAVKEAVDNSLDACEDAGILPEVWVEIAQLAEDRFRIAVQDNGPGIVRNQIGNVFGKLLYGSKFHRRRMARGQQGIGISAAGLYAQLTTGKPMRIVTKPAPKKPALEILLQIDMRKNAPQMLSEKESEVPWTTGTRVEMELEAKYQRGARSVDEYVAETAIANPHATIHYVAPDGEKREYERTTKELPPSPQEIKPHPRGVELGLLIKMLQATKSRNVAGFLKAEFSRVSPRVAAELCKLAGVVPETKPRRLTPEESEKLFRAMNSDQVKIMAPAGASVVPIGESLVERSLRARVPAEFFTAVTRSPAVYRGNPFIIEVGIGFGGQLPLDQAIQLFRYANRVPLLYQQSACAITEAVCDVDWKGYGLQQTRGQIPVGPAVIFVHMASVWVPFTSESKEAVAGYPEIEKEIRLGLQECGRRLQGFVNKRAHIAYEAHRRSLFDRYIPEVADAVASLTKVSKKELVEQLAKIAKKTTAKADEAPVANGRVSAAVRELATKGASAEEGAKGKTKGLFGEDA